MNLCVKWRYTGEEQVYERKYYDIDAESIRIRDGFLSFDDGKDSSWMYKLDYIVEMNSLEDDKMNAYFEVGYNVGDGIFSVNVLYGTEKEANSYAKEYAQKHGYEVGYLVSVSEVRATADIRKGMPSVRL